MAWTKGFNFRLDNTATGFQDIDGVNETYVLNEAWTGSVIRNGVSFGYENGTNTSVNMRNRNASPPGDRRLAGVHFLDQVLWDFRIDLPAPGDYIFRCALGDPQTTELINFIVQDNTTTRLTLFQASVPADSFIDATNVIRTRAAWPGSNAPNTLTFTSTIFRLQFNQTAPTTEQAIAHLFLDQVASAASLPGESMGRGVARGMFRGER